MSAGGTALPGTSAADDGRFFDELYRREFAPLHDTDEAYLDFAGAALYGCSQLDAHDRLLRRERFGNPHSENAPSRRATRAIEAARDRVIRFFGVDRRTHEVCFTANASAALRLVGEGFDFARGRPLVLAADNHNSVRGIARFARRAGAEVHTLPLDAELRLEQPVAELRRVASPRGGLFAFPAQSNFSGVHHPLGLVETARALGFTTLLDAAAFVPAHPLDLSAIPADFTALSFYKMFGFPTGVGALVARREALDALSRPWFSGGTVLFASGDGSRHRLRPGAEGFEDGTSNFLAIAALDAGFDLLERIGHGRITRRVLDLTGLLLAGLTAARHPGGAPLVRILGPAGLAARGGTVAFNLLAPDGAVVPYPEVEARARAAGVSVRGGCFCNPGAAEAALGIDPRRLAPCLDRLADDFTPERLAACLEAPVGAVRASLGVASRRHDIDRALALVASFRSPTSSASLPVSPRPSASGTSTSATFPRPAIRAPSPGDGPASPPSSPR